MNKQPQTYGIWVKASETEDILPLEIFMHIRDNLGCPRMGNFFKDENDSICFSVCGTEMYETFTIPNKDLWSIEWVQEQQSIILSVDEWEAVKNTEQVLKDVNKAIQNSNMKDTVLHTQIKQALSQLNTKP